MVSHLCFKTCLNKCLLYLNEIYLKTFFHHCIFSRECVTYFHVNLTVCTYKYFLIGHFNRNISTRRIFQKISAVTWITQTNFNNNHNHHNQYFRQEWAFNRCLNEPVNVYKHIMYVFFTGEYTHTLINTHTHKTLNNTHWLKVLRIVENFSNPIPFPLLCYYIVLNIILQQTGQQDKFTRNEALNLFS